MTKLSAASTVSHRYAEQASAPSTPASGFGLFYVKNDGTPHFINDSGTDSDLTSAATNITISATEAVTLTTYDYVYLNSSGNADKVDTDSTTPKLGRVRGIVTDGAGTGTATVTITGEVTNGSWAWTVGDIIYASTTAGSLTATKPSPSDGGGQIAVVEVGIATAATKILLTPETEVEYLKRDTLANNATSTIVHHTDANARGREVRGFVSTSNTTDVASYSDTNQDVDVMLRGGSGAGGVLDKNNTGGTYHIGDFNDADGRIAQQFTPSAGILTQFKFTQGANTGSPAGGIYWEIRTTTSGSPGTLLDSGGPVSSTPSAENTVNVTNGPFLDGATKYWLVLYASAQPTNVRYTIVTNSGGGTTYAGHEFKNSNDGGATWSNPGRTASFEVTTSAVSANDKLSQSFQLASTETIDKVQLYLKKVGSPAGTMTCRIETDSAGNPSGTLADANATVTVSESSLGTSYADVTFDFATNFSLSGSTTYWLVLSTSRTASNTNYVEWGADASAPGYASGEMKSEVSAVWSAESKDAIFIVDRESVVYDEPLAVGRWSGGTRDAAVRYDDGADVNPDTNTTLKNVSGSSLDITFVVRLP